MQTWTDSTAIFSAWRKKEKEKDILVASVFVFFS